MLVSAAILCFAEGDIFVSDNLLYPGNIGIDHKGIVGIVYHKAGFGAVWLFDMFFFYIVDLHLSLSPPFGVVGGEPCGFLEGGVGKLCALRADDHMGAGLSFGVKPPVVSDGKFKGQFWKLFFPTYIWNPSLLI